MTAFRRLAITAVLLVSFGDKIQGAANDMSNRTNIPAKPVPDTGDTLYSGVWYFIDHQTHGHLTYSYNMLDGGYYIQVFTSEAGDAGDYVEGKRYYQQDQWMLVPSEYNGFYFLVIRDIPDAVVTVAPGKMDSANGKYVIAIRYAYSKADYKAGGKCRNDSLWKFQRNDSRTTGKQTFAIYNLKFIDTGILTWSPNQPYKGKNYVQIRTDLKGDALKNAAHGREYLWRFRAVDTCPTKCGAISQCDCKDRTKKGKFSCTNSKCRFCAYKRTNCKYNGTLEGAGYDGPNAKEVPCCDAGKDNRNMTCQKTTFRGRFLCSPICDASVAKTTCRDKTNRPFTGQYKSCSGPSGTPNTWTECVILRGYNEDTNQPRECGATGATCTKAAVGPAGTLSDTCCVNFICDKGTCRPECPEGDSTCKVNVHKEPCGESIVAGNVSCKDNTGREFRERYTSCKGSKPNRWIECSKYRADAPAECGSTDQPCTYFAKRHDCCFQFKCGLKDKCVPQCPSTSNDSCTPVFSKSLCFYKNVYKTCKDPVIGRDFSAKYLECQSKDGTKPNTFIECTGGDQPRECGTTGASCNVSAEIKNCCLNFKCNIKGKCIAECPAGSPSCTPATKPETCRIPKRECKDQNTGKVLKGKFLYCDSPTGKNNTFVECLGDSKPPRECGTTGAECTATGGTLRKDSCCTGFECGTADGNKCKLMIEMKPSN